MAKTIDERIVEMRFDNKQFEDGVAESRKSIQNLQKTLDSTTGEHAFDGLSKAAQNIDLSAIARGVDSLQSRFSAFGIAGMRVIENLTDKVMGLGSRMMSMTFGQIKSGGKARATNIENARFSMTQLLKDAERVDKVMENVDHSVTGTAYSMDQAAKAASVLVSSGFKEGEELEGVLKSIAGVTATANADYDSIAHIFQNIAGQGRIMGQELNEFAARGLNVAEDLAEYYREVKHEANMTAADIRKLMSDPKTNVSSKDFFDAMLWKYKDAAFKANETINGVTNNIRSALSRIGADFYAPLVESNNEIVQLLNTVRTRINDIHEITKPYAKDMAQSVLNVAKSIDDVLKELDVGTLFNGIANLGRPLIAVLKEIGAAFKEVFPSKGLKGLNEGIKGFRNFTARLQISNKALAKIKTTATAVFKVLKLGIDTVKKLAKAFVDLIKKIPKAELDFSSFINLKKSLKNFINGFDFIKDWFAGIKKSFDEGGRGLSGVFNVVFEQLSAGIEKVTGLIKKYTSLDVSGFTTKIVNGITKIQTVIVDLVSHLEDTLWKFPQEAWGKYETLSAKISGVIFEILKGITETISDFVYDLTGYDLSELADKIKNALATAEEKVTDFCENFKEKLIPVANKLAEVRDYLKEITQMISPGSLDIFNGLGLKAVSAISFTSVVALIMTEVDKIKHTIDFLKGTVETLKGIPTAITTAANTIKSGLQTIGGAVVEINVPSILGVAASLAILAASLYALTKVDSEKLSQTIVAFTVALGELWLVTRNLTTQSTTVLKELAGLKTLERIRFNSLALQLLSFSAAIFIVAKAFEAMGQVETYRVTSSLLALTTGIGLMLKAFKSIVEYAGSMPKGKMSLQDHIKTIIGKSNVNQMFKEILIFSASIYVLAKAAETLANIPDLEHAAVGIGGVAAAMVGLVQVAKALGKLETANKRMVKTAASLIIFGLAVKLIVDPIKQLAELQWNEALQGVIGIGLVMAELTGVVIAIDKLTKYKVDKGAFTSMLSISIAVSLLANAIKKLGSLSLTQISKGIITVGLALFELVGAVKFLGDSGIATKTAFGFLLLAVSLRVIASAITEVASVDIDAIGMAFTALSIILLEMMAGSYLLKDNLLQAGAGFLMLSIGVRAVASAVTELASLNLDQLGVGLAGLTAVLAEMILTVKILGKDPGETLVAAASMAIIAAAIRILTPALVELSKFKDITALEQLGGALLILVAATKFLGTDPKILIGAAAIAILAASLLLLAPALKILSTIDGFAAVTSLAGALAVLAGVAAILGSTWEVMLIGAGVMLAFGAAAMVLAMSLSITASSFSLIVGLLPAFADGMNQLCDAIKNFPNDILRDILNNLGRPSVLTTFLSVGIGFAAIGTGMYILGAGLAQIMPYKDQLEDFALELEKMLVVLEANVDPLKKFAGGMMAVGAAGIVVGIAMAVVVSALNKATPLYEKIGDLVVKIQDAVVAIGNAVTGMADGLVAIGNNGAGIKDAFMGMAEGLGIVAAANLTTVATQINTLGGNFETIAKSSTTLKDDLISVTTTLTLFQDSVLSLNTNLNDFSHSFAVLDATLVKLQETSSNVFMTLVQDISTFCTEIQDSMTMSANAVADTAQTAAQNVLKAFSEKLSAKQGNWLGENIMRGLAQGIRKNISSAVQAAHNAAMSVNREFQIVAQVHSPSDFTEWVGENYDVGLADGITDNADKPVNAAKDVTTDVNSAFDQIDFSKLSVDADGNIKGLEELQNMDFSNLTELGNVDFSNVEGLENIDLSALDLKEMMNESGAIDINKFSEQLGGDAADAFVKGAIENSSSVQNLKNRWAKFIADGQVDVDAVSGESYKTGVAMSESLVEGQKAGAQQSYAKLSDEELIKMGIEPPKQLTAEDKAKVEEYNRKKARAATEAYLDELKKTNPGEYYAMEKKYYESTIQASIEAQKIRVKDIQGQQKYNDMLKNLNWALDNIHNSNKGVADEAQKIVDKYQKMANGFDQMANPKIIPVVDMSNVEAAHKEINKLLYFDENGQLKVEQPNTKEHPRESYSELEYWVNQQYRMMETIANWQGDKRSPMYQEVVRNLEIINHTVEEMGGQTQLSEIFNTQLQELNKKYEEAKASNASKEEQAAIKSQITDLKAEMKNLGIKEEDLEQIKASKEETQSAVESALGNSTDKLKTDPTTFEPVLTNSYTAGAAQTASIEKKTHDERGFELNSQLKDQQQANSDLQLSELRSMKQAMMNPVPVNLSATVSVTQNDRGAWNGTVRQNDKFMKRTGRSRLVQ